MDLLRTPSERFDNLPGWPFEPRETLVGAGLRMAYVDEGPRDAAPVLLLHGEPSWSYLYRWMIPPLVAAGHRVIAPDLIGFGRSDKPADRSAHSYAGHVAWMTEFVVNRLDLTDITLFCQDWGGLIGLRVLAENVGRFGRAMIANTGLPTGDQSMPEAFLAWQTFSQTVETFPIGSMLQGATLREMGEAEVAAYDAPFPDESFKAGPRAMPALVPTSPDDPAAGAQRAAWKSLMTFDKPVVIAFSDSDPITGGGDRVFHKLVPGTAGQAHFTPHGGHFLQEDAGEELSAALHALINS